MKYRKRPVVIEAMQYTGDNFYEICDFVGKTLKPTPGLNASFLIETLEGEMQANLSDYIIKGIRGEFYPCKPDIFEQTYEAVI